VLESGEVDGSQLRVRERSLGVRMLGELTIHAQMIQDRVQLKLHIVQIDGAHDFVLADGTD